MRYVDCVGDFDDEAEWCAQCGAPVDVDSGYDNDTFDGQGFVALITPHGCLKWLEGEPTELEHGMCVSNMYWDV